MTTKERLKIRLLIIKNNLKIQYNKMIMRKNMLKLFFTIIKIKLIPLRMRLAKLRFVLLPLKMVFCMPGYLFLGLLAILSVLINRNNYDGLISLFICMMNPDTLTDEQKQYIEKWLDFSYHISFWFWISLFIIFI